MDIISTPLAPASLVRSARGPRNVRHIAAVALATVCGTVTLALGGPVHAADRAISSVSVDTPGCVSRDEWRQVYIVADGTGSGPGSGGTLRRIHRVFGTAGERVALDEPDPGFRYQVRQYDGAGAPAGTA